MTHPQPPFMPVEVFKDWLEDHPEAVGLQNADCFDRDVAYVRWLEQTGVFARLGLAMHLALQRAPVPLSSDVLAAYGVSATAPQVRELGQWLTDVGLTGFAERQIVRPEALLELCALFGVPPLCCEVAVLLQMAVLHFDSLSTMEERGELRWDPPEPALAADVLKNALARGVSRMGLSVEEATVLRHHPSASAWRLRSGVDGEWTARPILGGEGAILAPE